MLLDPSRFRPLGTLPDLRVRVVDLIGPDAAAALGGCGAVEEDAAQPLWLLSGLLFPLGSEERRFFPEGGEVLEGDAAGPQAIKDWLGKRGPTPDTPVQLAWGGYGALTLPWGTAVRWLLGAGQEAVVVPADMSWVCLDHYSEHLIVGRPRLGGVQSISFVDRWRGPEGRLVPRPRYVLQFIDGHRWTSETLSDKQTREAHDAVFGYLARLTGKGVRRVELETE